jgi:hypothetical protein
MSAMKVPFEKGQEGDLEFYKKLSMAEGDEDIEEYEKNLPQLPVEQRQCAEAAGTLSLLLVPTPGPVIQREVQPKLVHRGLRPLILPSIQKEKVAEVRTYIFPFILSYIVVDKSILEGTGHAPPHPSKVIEPPSHSR